MQALVVFNTDLYRSISKETKKKQSKYNFDPKNNFKEKIDIHKILHGYFS